jgi:hypothetical protein
MEKVQFQLESTLPELKDFHDKGLFTKVCLDLTSFCTVLNLASST